MSFLNPLTAKPSGQVAVHFGRNQTPTKCRIGNHRPTQVSGPRELSDPAVPLGDIVADTAKIKAVNLGGQQQELARNIVAESLDRRVRGSTADAGLTEQQVHQLVQQRERPRGLGIAIVDDDQRGDLVRYDESTIYLDIDGGVVAAQVPLEQHEDACCFGARS